MALITCPECTREVSDTASACPGCGFEVMKRHTRTGTIIKQHSIAGRGCFTQLLAFPIAAVVGGLAGAINRELGGVVGLVTLYVVFKIGQREANILRCSKCNNRLASDKVEECPSCRTTLAPG